MSDTSEWLDYAIVVALGEEFDPLLRELADNGLKYALHERSARFQVTAASGCIRTGVVFCYDDQGPAASSAAVARVLSEHEVGLLAVVGISGILDDAIELCDVVVGEEADYYSKRAKPMPSASAPTVKWSGEERPTSYDIVTSLRSSVQTAVVLNDRPTAFRSKSRACNSAKPSVHFGKIASGENIISDPEMKATVLERSRNFLCVDTESGPILATCFKHPRPPLRTVVIRGMSDYAVKKSELDQASGGSFRRTAMINACRVLLGPALEAADKVLPKRPPSPTSQYSAISEQASQKSKIGDVHGEPAALSEAYLDPTSKAYVCSRRAFEAYVDRGQPLKEADRPSDAECLLISQYILTNLVRLQDVRSKKKGVDARVLDYLYPHKVNEQFKQLMTSSTLVEERAFRALSRLFGKKGSAKRDAYIAYALGRVVTPQLRAEAIRLLLGRLQKLDQSRPMSTGSRCVGAEELLLYRSVYISLVYLGHIESAKQYIKQCMMDRQWDDLNRGFHLEYYGDQSYSPTLRMLGADSLCAFPRTFKTLTDKLRRVADGGPRYSLFEVEVYTLFSLAQQRHCRQRLGQEQRLMLLELANQLLSDRHIEYPRLEGYIRMVHSHLGIDPFYPRMILDEVCQLKRVRRSGWNAEPSPGHLTKARRTSSPESVADHTWSALLLAKRLLPVESISEENRSTYSKRQIMEMLLIHDLGETLVGDLLPWQKSESTKVSELNAHYYFDHATTYPDFAADARAASLWEDFEDAKSYNGLVAKDIDKLECLLQLYIELDRGSDIPDADDWINDIAASIRTDEGRRIQQIIQQGRKKSGR